MRKTTEDFARELGLTARRVIAIETMPKPDVQHTTIVSLAKAFGIDPEEFEHVWKTTPVPVTRRKMGPTTDEAQRFTRACAAVGINPAEGQRRLRSWIVEQNARIQHEALSYVPPHRVGSVESTSMFSGAVDHVQDPAAASRKRISRKAATSAKSRGSGETPSGKRR